MPSETINNSQSAAVDNGQWFEEPSVSLAAVVSPMREVHRRLGGVKQDELMVNGQWLMLNGQCLTVNV